LNVALEKNLKIIYVCRIHAQSFRVIKELKKIHNTSYKNSLNSSGSGGGSCSQGGLEAPGRGIG